MPYFNKILIANRGEIAVRLIRACQELGIRTVAVYSEADRQALHVRLADEAYLIGPAPAAESYLRADKIVAVARECGAEAVHPGYGFLSERAHFAQACAEAGVVFIGPPVDAIERMGSKIESKRLAIAHDVPVVPGYDGADQASATLQAEAERIGYPLLIKASAGGGGKGMRSVHEAAEFVAALEGAKREAKAAFGDDAVLLEKLILRPRHVEIQVLADAHGNTIYLGERECSIQRRHQKIVEESPSVALTPELRARMGAAAVRVAEAVGYRNAGTVEFMLDEDGQFYFLEMNTRLQVEHPVTELVTGLDLVHLQLAVAAGEPLPLTQSDVSLRGHAIEVRIYAEDPVTMLPSVGRVALFAPPEGPGIRNDAGLATGDEVSVNYDPMLAKLIVSAPTRAAAIQRLSRALDDFAVLGITSNIPLLQAIAEHPAFAEGATTTDFLQTHAVGEALRQPDALPQEVLYAAAIGDLLHRSGAESDPWAVAWRAGGADRRLVYRFGEQQHVMLAAQRGDRTWRLAVDGTAREVTVVAARDHALTLAFDNTQSRLHVAPVDDAVLVGWRGRSYRLQKVQALSVDALSSIQSGVAGHTSLEAPMPGTIIKVLVKAGDHVTANQPLLVMEAMKMEHTIVAPYAGVVGEVPFAAGQLVSGGATLIELDAEEA
ncbi:MAG TPA: acetyl-CoA carboxylase biotin carboxylase subunit [Herpetosiphonaceae bacterium]